jgi:hypothetical protein
MLPVTLCYVARGDICNEKTSFKPLPDKAARERRNSETYELFIYLITILTVVPSTFHNPVKENQLMLRAL